MSPKADMDSWGNIEYLDPTRFRTSDLPIRSLDFILTTPSQLHQMGHIAYKT